MSATEAGRFTLVELVVATVLIGMLMSLFVAAVRLTEKMSVAFKQEQQAILVLRNTVERLAGPTAPSLQAAGAVLAEELQLADMPARPRVVADCSAVADGIALAIRRPNGRAIVRVVLGKDYEP